MKNDTNISEKGAAGVPASNAESAKAGTPFHALVGADVEDLQFVEMMCPIADLHDNPLNPEIYGDDCDEGLEASVGEHGILDPLVVSDDLTILGGHRRLRAAKAAGLVEVPVRKVRVSGEKAEELMLDLNISRHKLMEVRLREYACYKKLESAKAAKRQGRRNDIGANLPGSEAGPARKLAAQKVGMKAKTAEHGLRVLMAVHEHAGDNRGKEVLDILNNQSTHAAWKKAQELGWVPAPSRRSKNNVPDQVGHEAATGEVRASQDHMLPMVNAVIHDNTQEVGSPAAPPSTVACFAAESSEPEAAPGATATAEAKSEPTPAVAPAQAPEDYELEKIESSLARFGHQEETARTADEPLFTLLDGTALRASTWPEGWVTAEEVAIKLKGVTGRYQNDVRQQTSDQDILWIQQDLVAIAHLVNQLGGGEPQAGRLRIMNDAMTEVGNFIRVRAKD